MSHWNKMKRFGKKRWYPEPNNERQWDTLYRGHKTVVPNLQKLTLEWSKVGAGQTGVRHFKYYNVKPLQFWNKELQVLENKKEEETTPKVTVQLKNGTIHELLCKDLTNTQILEKVVKLDPEGQIVTNGPGHLIQLE